MNKTAEAKTLRTYLNSDRRWCSQKRSTVAFRKRIIRRMERRTNKFFCVVEA